MAGDSDRLARISELRERGARREFLQLQITFCTDLTKKVEIPDLPTEGDLRGLRQSLFALREWTGDRGAALEIPEWNMVVEWSHAARRAFGAVAALFRLGDDDLAKLEQDFGPEDNPAWRLLIARAELARNCPDTLPAPVAAKPTQDGPWSRPKFPKEWAKMFGFSRDTFIRRCKAGTIRHKKLSDRKYVVYLADVPSPPTTSVKSAQVGTSRHK